MIERERTKLQVSATCNSCIFIKIVRCTFSKIDLMKDEEEKVSVLSQSEEEEEEEGVFDDWSFINDEELEIS